MRASCMREAVTLYNVSTQPLKTEEEEALTYVAGYVARRLRKRLKCPVCSNKQCADSYVTESFLSEKLYDNLQSEGAVGLYQPSDALVHALHKVENAIAPFLLLSLHCNNLISFLNKQVKTTLSCLSDSLFCAAHTQDVLIVGKIYINVRLFGVVRRINKKAALSGNNRSNKLNNLMGM